MKTSVDFIILCCSLLILNQCSAELSLPIITVVNGSNPINESSILSLKCFTNTTQRTVVTWYRSGYQMQTKLDGSVSISNVPYDRYRILSDNSTLRIIPNYMDDNVYFQCYVSYPDLGTRSATSNTWTLTVNNYRPVITSFSPTSKRANPINSEGPFYVYYQLNPAVTSVGSGVTWTFRPSNTTSSLDDVIIPVQSTAPYYFNVYVYGYYSQLSFSLRAGLLYTGNYTCRVYNNLGSAIAAFQFLDAGPPEPPIGLVLNPTLPTSINVQWTAMWNNGPTQYFAIQLINLDTNATIGFQPSNSDPGYNITTSLTFSSNVHQLTTYKVRIWSYNSMGNSSVVEAVTRTPPMPVLSVSESSINISGSLATVNYSISNINSSSSSGYVFLEIACCESPVSTTTCGRVSFPVYSYQMTGKQSLVIPLADEYYFQFRLSNIFSVLFSAIDMKVGVKNSTVAPTDSMTSGSTSSSSTGTVVALAVLLALSLLTTVGSVVALVVISYRHKKSSSKTDRKPPGSNIVPNGTENRGFYSGPSPAESETTESTSTESGYMPLARPLETKQVIDEAVYEKLQQKPPTKNKPRRN